MKPAQVAAERLSGFICELMPWWPLHGGAVAIVDREGTLAQFGFGLADAERSTAATAWHLFQIGSISKTVLGVVVQQLVDEGVVDLDEAISVSLPWAEVGGESPTWRALLSHTAGLIMGGDGVPDDLAQLWALRGLVRSDEQHFHYSNLGFMLLGRALEARTGRTVAELIATRVLEPLAMTSSAGSIEWWSRERSAVGYWPLRDDIPWAPGDPLTPAAWFRIDSADGCVTSSAADMARFARLLLSDGDVDGTRLMSAAAIERMSTPTANDGEDIVSLTTGPQVTSSQYGLGVNIETIGGHTCLTHGGGMVGFQSFVLADRSEGVGVVVLTNANGCYPIAQVIARAAYQLLVDPDASLPSARDAVAASGPTAAVGTFASVADPTLTVSVEVDGGELLLLRGGDRVGRLTRLWSGRYVTDHLDLRTFHWDLSEDGRTWTHGPLVLGASTESHGRSLSEEDEAIMGDYRSYSPWFPWLRIIARNGRLMLVAPGGVEAPAEEMELVALGEREWRIGSDGWLPERLECGPVVNGMALSVLRDGVPYSRTMPG